MRRSVYITDRDHAAIRRLLAATSAQPYTMTQIQLRGKLETAVVVPAHLVAPSVVTLGSRIILKDLRTHTSGEYALARPGDALLLPNAISVLSPAGVALIGQQEDDVVEWGAAGDRRRFYITNVVFQPESSARFPWAETLPPGHPAQAPRSES